MRGYNIWRPIMLILVALVTRSLVTNLGVMFGMSQNSASSVAVIVMLIVAFTMYNRMMKNRRR
ncbi:MULTISPECIES: hypothetical protein [Paenibacillus]|uniref:Uncharacterized protein n=1 Tax=Paenibacillus agri TaxID=2744309 RepID=A0A850EP68_9BACL|nr:hypothetical protein [Paenibacillus agri]NUU61560.1 hypothetical protein [Paenibacillus agri]